MGGPARSMRMQRTLSDWFCTASVGAPIRFLASARAAALFCPSADKGGIFPSGGSTISDVRRFKAQPALVPVQPELGEVIVHVGYGSGFRLLAFGCG